MQVAIQHSVHFPLLMRQKMFVVLFFPDRQNYYGPVFWQIAGSCLNPSFNAAPCH